MLGAIAIGQYAVDHAFAAFYEMGADEAIGLARRLLDWIQEEPVTTFTRRDAYNRLRGTIHRVEEIDEPLRLLVDHAFIRPRDTKRKGRGRKPSQKYEVHPHFPAQNTQNAQNLGSVTTSADAVRHVS